MKILLFIVYIIYTTVTPAFGQVEFSTPCPAQVAASNFNLTAYLGRWYELQRYESEFGEKGDCVISVFEKTNDNETISARLEISLLPNTSGSTGASNSTQKIITNGTLRLSELTSMTPAGHLIANFGGNSTNYLVLNTDYVTYALVWSCENLDDNRSQRKS